MVLLLHISALYSFIDNSKKNPSQKSGSGFLDYETENTSLYNELVLNEYINNEIYIMDFDSVDSNNNLQDNENLAHLDFENSKEYPPEDSNFFLNEFIGHMESDSENGTKSKEDVDISNNVSIDEIYKDEMKEEATYKELTNNEVDFNYIMCDSGERLNFDNDTSLNSVSTHALKNQDSDCKNEDVPVNPKIKNQV